ncbi:MAG: kynureninase [Bacteroidota bacterium]|jgi:kynureninase
MNRFENTESFALSADAQDAIASLRDAFHFPSVGRESSIYFCGNSLGLQPVKASTYIQQELEDWSHLGVEGHMHARKPWFPYHEFLRESTARLVGGMPHEVVVMNSLTVNLHLLMVSFYRPQGKRFKILFENGPFSSDRYAFASQAAYHGLDPKEALVELPLRDGEQTHRNEDVIQAIQDLGDSLALVLIGGVNYYSGQLFDMQSITKAAHEVGAVVGFDLAHAAGNIPLKLHDWDVDFAAWCSYKYLNAGPGAVAGAFVHDRHSNNSSLPRFAGWWGNDPETRFTMPTEFIPRKGADGWQLSNAPVFSMAALRASMELFDEAGMDRLSAKSQSLTSYLEYVVGEVNHAVKGVNHIGIITPQNWRGCQLSLVVSKNGKAIHDALLADGIITDWRHPDVIRVAPVPMYNSFLDVYQFGQSLIRAIQSNS